MTADIRRLDSLRRQTDRAITIGDRYSAVALRARLCAACGMRGGACISSQRRSCQPVGPRIA